MSLSQAEIERLMKEIEKDCLRLTIEAMQKLNSILEIQTAEQDCTEIDDMLEHLLKKIRAS